MNNFYLYRSVNATRFRILPWDEDFTFQFVDTSALRHGNDSHDVALFARAFAEPDLRETFINAEDQCAHVIGDDNWLLGEVNRIDALIRVTAEQDTKKQVLKETYIEGLEKLQRFAIERPGFLFKEVDNLRAGR